MIEVLVGMIASGKSTWAARRANEGWVVLNDDAIVSAVHGGDYTLYSKELKFLYKSIEDHILHTAVAMGRNVVVDRGLDIRATSRRRWIALAKSLDVPINAVIFKKEAPEVHARRRSDSDSRGHDYNYWLKEVAEVHDRQWVRPSRDEGFDDIITYEYIQ